MKNKSAITSILLLCVLNGMLLAQKPVLNIDLSAKGNAISPLHYGIFFEDINHAADGGLYAELIRNRSFEDDTNPLHWSNFLTTGASITTSVETTGMLNGSQKRALKMSVITDGKNGSKAGVYNEGYWGIPITKGQKYRLSFFAKCNAGYSGRLSVSLENAAADVYAADTLYALTTEWKKYSFELTANGSDEKGRLVIALNTGGTVWLDVVSLFPPTFKNRENGMRPELAQLLADLKPKFMRFPGGCFVEGDVLANRFQWKNTIGNIEERPGHWNLWGYRSSDGLGYHEYLQLAEDLKTEPLYVINIGVAHNDYRSVDNLNEYIQDALDAIEYANGDASTPYGAMRAANGHPEPFNMKYIEIGNENYHNNRYEERYALFRNAIKAKYPEIQLIGNVAAWGTDNPIWPFSQQVDFLDEHYYRNPQWFINQYHKYDSYDRNGPKIYVGEYAVTSECGKGNLNAALGEAVYMAGMEINSDIVSMNSYAPIFVNDNDRTWNPDMIVLNASSVYTTPSYYVQKLFANNIGTVNLQVKDSANTRSETITGNVGLGTWATTAQYTAVTVKAENDSTVFSDTFRDASNWTTSGGTWNVSAGTFSQTSSSTDCRAVSAKVTVPVYTYSLKAKKNGGNEGFLIIFGYKDSNNFYWWNIGGWNNTQHAIEKCTNGTKTTVASQSGSIETNVWYDIRIEISGNKVLCYLNNVLIHSLENERILYTSASMDEQNGGIYLKVVNPSDTEAETVIRFKTGEQLTGLTGTVNEMSSSSGTDENSFETPLKVIPVESDILVTGKELNFVFKANSINVFHLVPQYSTSIQSSEKKQGVRISPNPVTDFISFNGLDETAGEYNMEIYDLSGRKILRRQVSFSDNIDLSSLPSGIYLLKLKGEQKSYSLKFIKL